MQAITETMQLSSLLEKFNEPETLKMAKLGRELRAKGADVIDLSLGEPDFDTPQHIKEAAKKAIDDNFSHYTPVAGYLDLREAVCTKLKRDNNLDYKPENIVASTGAKQSLANVMLALVDEGEEVIIPTPYWVTYSELVKIARGKVVEIQSTTEQGFKITAQQLEAAITPKTKLFLFSSPCNPSGAVYSSEELATQKADLAAQFDILSRQREALDRNADRTISALDADSYPAHTQPLDAYSWRLPQCQLATA